MNRFLLYDTAIRIYIEVPVPWFPSDNRGGAPTSATFTEDGTAQPFRAAYQLCINYLRELGPGRKKRHGDYIQQTRARELAGLPTCA